MKKQSMLLRKPLALLLVAAMVLGTGSTMPVRAAIDDRNSPMPTESTLPESTREAAAVNRKATSANATEHFEPDDDDILLLTLDEAPFALTADPSEIDFGETVMGYDNLDLQADVLDFPLPIWHFSREILPIQIIRQM